MCIQLHCPICDTWVQLVASHQNVWQLQRATWLYPRRWTSSRRADRHQPVPRFLNVPCFTCWYGSARETGPGLLYRNDWLVCHVLDAFRKDGLLEFKCWRNRCQEGGWWRQHYYYYYFIIIIIILLKYYNTISPVTDFLVTDIHGMRALQVTLADISDCFSEEAPYHCSKYLISWFTTRLWS